jgi:hypothetical protein
MSTSRESARDALVTLLSASLVGTGLPCKTVTGSKVEELTGLTPLTAVLSAGSVRERMTFQGDRPTFKLNVQVWVRQACDGWTNAEAEDALDEIESIIAGVYESNRRTDNWEMLEYAGNTTVVEVSVSGVKYYLEIIPTLVKVAKS